MPYKDKEKQRQYELAWKKKKLVEARIKVAEMFGNKCAHCGYDKNILVFQIDHIKPILRKVGEADPHEHIWLKLAAGSIKPDGLQMLCANCHVIKTLTIDIPTFKKVGRPRKIM